MAITLYDYWRSSASYRVRIALNLKGIAYETAIVDLLSGEHRKPEHMARNPQGLLPALDIDGQMLTQSLAMIEYLEETRPTVKLLPSDPVLRAQVRTAALSIAMEIHPVCNLNVGNHVAELVGGEPPHKDAVKKAWMQHFIRKGLLATEALVVGLKAHSANTGPFLCGVTPGLFECCLVPQMYNVQRWEVDASGLSNLLAITEACSGLDAFKRAAPEHVRG
jgi:maleylacetoacetate isomerase